MHPEWASGWRSPAPSSSVRAATSRWTPAPRPARRSACTCPVPDGAPSAVQELPDAPDDAGRVETMLGVEALGVAGLAEPLDAQALHRRWHHLGKRLGDRAAEPARDRVVLDCHHVARLAGRAQQELLVQWLDARRVDHLGGDPVALQALGRLQAVE